METITYGAAVLLAQAYHDENKEDFALIVDNLEIGELVASTFQLAHYLLSSIPGGKLSSTKEIFDITDEAFDCFSEHISKGTAKASSFSNIDPLYVVTATTTIVMGSIVPMLENYDPPAVNIEQEGLDNYGFMTIMASISEACIESFRTYIGIMDTFYELGVEPSYESASEKLLSAVPRLTYSLENKEGRTECSDN